MDPQTLCRIASSCEEARQVDDTHYEGTIRAKMSLLVIRAHVAGEVRELREAESMNVAVTGRTTGLPGSFQGVADISLSRRDGATDARYEIEMTVLGRLGDLGRPFFQLTAQRMATKFAEKLSRYLADRG
jgi:carbon monoxide dehydrogenase subunit G